MVFPRRHVKPKRGVDGGGALSRSVFHVEGLHCHHEVNALREHVLREAGVAAVEIDQVRGMMTVEHDEQRVPPEHIIQAAKRAGLRAWPRGEKSGSGAGIDKARVLETALVLVSGIALLAGVGLDGFSVHTLGQPVSFSGDGAGESLAPGTLFCYLLSLLTGLWFIVPKAYRSIAGKHIDMNVLVGLSAGGAVFLGEWGEAASVAFLFSLARLLENWSGNRARRALGRLMRTSALTARVRHDGHTHEVPAERVRRGDVVMVKPGECIPCDGEILTGISSVLQTALTGEAIPEVKTPGDSVLAGCVNCDGLLEIRAVHSGSNTVAGKMASVLDGCARHRSPVELWIERFARTYTPAVIGLAAGMAVIGPILLGGGWNLWLYRSMLVLLISCPCALVISTPVTITAALASAARRGVLIKSGAVLELAARLRAVAFDKTGVLTIGEPSVSEMFPVNGHTEDSVLSVLASLEQMSEHPLGRAICQFAGDRKTTTAQVQNGRAAPGRGVEACIDGKEFWAGSFRMMGEKGAGAADIDELWDRLSGGAHTVVACGSNDRLHALLTLTDRLRPEASASVDALKRLGVEHCAILTGDSSRTAEGIAAALQLDEFQSGLLPAEKASRVAALVASHETVAMVGDGMNDALALAEAPVGIAFGKGATDFTAESANVVILRDDLRLLPFLIRHARRTMRVVKANIALALALKALFLILAAMNMATLWMAVLADTGATILVTFNGLRMLRAGKPYHGSAG